MSQIDWTNPQGGSFTDSANWSGGVVPGAKDTAVIGYISDVHAVTFDGNQRVAGLDFAGNTFVVQAGDLTVGGGVNDGVIFVDAILNIQHATFENGGEIYITGGRDASTLALSNATLTGDGLIQLHHKDSNIVSDNMVTNVGNTIFGEGSVECSQLVNGAAGVIEVHSLGVKHGSIENAGTIQSTGDGLGGGGHGVVYGHVDNTGVLEAYYVTMTLKGTVSGTGTAIIDGGTLDFQSSFSQNVTFTARGTLELARSQKYAAIVTGFSATGATTLDLRDIGFANASEASFSGTASGGVLTVTDGTHIAHISLNGDYLGSIFVASSDGNGGVDVATASAQMPSIAHFASEMAGMTGHNVSAGLIDARPVNNGHQMMLVAPRLAIA